MVNLLILNNSTIEQWEQSSDTFKRNAAAGKLPDDICRIVHLDDDDWQKFCIIAQDGSPLDEWVKGTV
jgi:hypothetical protein